MQASTKQTSYASYLLLLYLCCPIKRKLWLGLGSTTGNSFASTRLQCRPKGNNNNDAAIQNPIICSAAPFLRSGGVAGKGAGGMGSRAMLTASLGVVMQLPSILLSCKCNLCVTILSLPVTFLHLSPSLTLLLPLLLAFNEIALLAITAQWMVGRKAWQKAPLYTMSRFLGAPMILTLHFTSLTIFICAFSLTDFVTHPQIFPPEVLIYLWYQTRSENVLCFLCRLRQFIENLTRGLLEVPYSYIAI